MINENAQWKCSMKMLNENANENAQWKCSLKMFDKNAQWKRSIKCCSLLETSQTESWVQVPDQCGAAPFFFSIWLLLWVLLCLFSVGIILVILERILFVTSQSYNFCTKMSYQWEGPTKNRLVREEMFSSCFSFVRLGWTSQNQFWQVSQARSTSSPCLPDLLGADRNLF